MYLLFIYLYHSTTPQKDCTRKGFLVSVNVKYPGTTRVTSNTNHGAIEELNNFISKRVFKNFLQKLFCINHSIHLETLKTF